MPTSAQRTSVIVASGLTPATKLVLLHLLSIARRSSDTTRTARTSTAKIALACDLTDRGVRKSLVMLTTAGLIREDRTDTARRDRSWQLNEALIDTLPTGDGEPT